MKFSASYATWSRGVSAVQGAVGSTLSNPILENIFIECHENQVSFMATNLSVTIRCLGEAQVEAPGSIVLPARVLAPLVQSLPNADVHFEEENANVKINCARFDGTLKGQDASLFPPFNAVEEGISYSLPADTLKSVIRKTLIATTNDNPRYELDGVKFDLVDGKLTCVSTDGRRLSVIHLDEDNFPNESLSLLVPTKALQVIQSALPDEGDVTIRGQERRVQFECGDTVVVSNLLVDKFPQYDRILPPPGEIKAKFSRSELLSAIRRAANLASQDTGMLMFRLKPGQLEVSGEREEVGGSGVDQIDAEYEGEPLEVRYNHKFITEALRVIEEDEVIWELFDTRKPGTFYGLGNDRYRYVIMPMRPPDNE